MAYIKKSIILLTCLFLIVTPLININNIEYSYADDDNWLDIANSAYEADRKITVAAIKAGLNVMGYRESFSYDAYKAIWSYSYDHWDKMAKLAGFEDGIRQFNRNVKYRIDQNSGLEFLFNVTGLNDLNALYEFLLEYYNIDQDSNKLIYSGEWFEDFNGVGAYVWYIKAPDSSKTTYNELVEKTGTLYTYSGASLNELTEDVYGATYPISFGFGTTTSPSDQVWNSQVNREVFNNNGIITRNYLRWGYKSDVQRARISGYRGSEHYMGYYIVYRNYNANTEVLDTARIFIGTYSEVMNDNAEITNYCSAQGPQIKNYPAVYDQNVRAHQEEKEPIDRTKPLIIYANYFDIDVFIEDNDPDVDTKPTKPQQDPVPPDSVTPNPNNPTITPGNPDFDFQMPDLDIDWKLNFNAEDLPFPFSIPFDLKNAFDSLNVIPQAPRFQGQVDLVITTWDIDIDFTPYNDYAEIVRKWFLFVYVVGLIVATRAVMHVY